MDIVKVNFAAMSEKLDRNTVNLERNETICKNVKTVVENVVLKVELVQEQLNKQEESNRRLEADNLETQKRLNEMTKQLERIAQETLHEFQTGLKQIKKGIAEAADMDREEKVVIAGGENDAGELNSVEVFSLSSGMWSLLQPMRERRCEASSVVYNNQFIITGGLVLKFMEKLPLNAVQADTSITWENVPAEAPGRLFGHCSVVYDGRLIVIGGFDADKGEYSVSITETTLVPPYTSKVLTTMRQRKCYHGVVLFGNEIVIVGGRERGNAESALKTVVMYDIITNQFKELASLPYPVYEMATVKWGDENVMLMGGVDSNNETLNKVLMYNVKTQRSYMLPDMKYKRQGCVAAVFKDTVIVMGGLDESGNCLKSVERFSFDRYTWEELPEMHEERVSATAAVC